MDMKKYSQKLILKRNELVSEAKRAGAFARRELSGEPMDTGDQSVSDQNREILLTQADRDTELLHEIEAALVRIGEGNYGRCLQCGRTIEEARLDAVPWTSYCAEHQKLHEPTEHPPVL